MAGDVQTIGCTERFRISASYGGMHASPTLSFARHSANARRLGGVVMPRSRGWRAPVWMSAVALAVASLGTVAPEVHAQSRLPSLGDPSEMTASQERRLGDRIIRELYRDPDYMEDPILQEYVQGIWQPLLATARQRGELSSELDERFAWEILLIKDRTVNAFALPGGYLGVHLGLVAVVTSQDELASVLAHELSHVTQRHISRLLTQQKNQTPLLLGAMVLGALAASKNPGATQALIVGGQALAVQSQLNFSRDMEREADRVGMGLMEPAGFAPQGFVTMFDKLQQANRLNDNGSWPYLRSHPLTTQRMADMQSRLPSAGGTVTALRSEETMLHAMMSARARVLANSGPDALRQRVEEAQGTAFAGLSAARKAGVLYGAALAASQLRDVEQARRWMGRLQDLSRDSPAAQRQIRLLAADMALRAQQPEQALTALAAVPASIAGSESGASQRPELLLRGQAQVLAHQPAPAAAALQTWVVAHPQDAGAWQLLASAWSAAQQPLRAVRAEAEAQAARCDYSAAVDRFKAGQEMARKSGSAADHIEASIIDIRLKAVESALREQAAER